MTELQKREKLLKNGKKRYTRVQVFLNKLVPTAVVTAIFFGVIALLTIYSISNLLLSYQGTMSNSVVSAYSKGKGDSFAQRWVSMTSMAPDEENKYLSNAVMIFDEIGEPYIVPEESAVLSVRIKGEHDASFYRAKDMSDKTIKRAMEVFSENQDSSGNIWYKFIVSRFVLEGDRYIPIEIKVLDQTENVIETIVSDIIPDNSVYSEDDIESAVMFISIPPENNPACEYIMVNSHSNFVNRTISGEDKKLSVTDITVDGKKLQVVEAMVLEMKALKKDIIAVFIPIAIVVCLIAAIIWSSVSYEKLQSFYALDDYRREMTNALAHDLKTPLMTISGYAETMAENPEKSGRYIDGIMENVRYMDEMIRKTLELSELESAVKKSAETSFAAEDIIKEILNKYAASLESRKITCSVNGSKTLTADRNRFTQLMENICSNAVKFTDEGGKIAVNISEDSIKAINTCRLAEKLELSDICKPYVKGDKSRGNRQGSGLGLAIAQNAAELLGYKLIITAYEGKFSAEIKL